MKRVMYLLFGGAILSGVAAWTAMAMDSPDQKTPQVTPAAAD